ncbi:uncharacterized protein LOC128262623 [Drosophila gunungcola]|uniref:Uncharacterized protein n=1 Tax=Drosophila gunungcola TaxID=103775 RepID=A0A9P9YSG6_9MUSC|nr:uncharacterized protein LOC128262623 [Drosophila gunungcola]KAI8042252.1 hypothetical protein M5D96_003554 [Drosophila gunungcola]
MKYKRMFNKRKQATPSPVRESEVDDSSVAHNHSALELEAAAALLLLRYQYDRQACNNIISYTDSCSPTPPPAVADNTTPKDQTVRPPVASQPLKKRSIPSHILRRSLTPAKSESSVSNKSITKAKTRTSVPNNERTCNKSLLKSCRNMIREFLDNQELI